jgi:peptide/nickel transport system permease protein
MFGVIARRLLQSLAVMAAVSAVSFALFNFVGDPVSNMLGMEASMEERVRVRTELGLDDPIITQYARFVGNAVQGDFGLSYRLRRPVQDLILERRQCSRWFSAYRRGFIPAFGATVGSAACCYPHL